MGERRKRFKLHPIKAESADRKLTRVRPRKGAYGAGHVFDILPASKARLYVAFYVKGITQGIRSLLVA